MLKVWGVVVAFSIGILTDLEQRRTDLGHLNGRVRISALNMLRQGRYIPSRSSRSGSESSFTVTGLGGEDTVFSSRGIASLLSSAMVAVE